MSINIILLDDDVSRDRTCHDSSVTSHILIIIVTLDPAQGGRQLNATTNIRIRRKSSLRSFVHVP